MLEEKRSGVGGDVGAGRFQALPERGASGGPSDKVTLEQKLAGELESRQQVSAGRVF